MIFRHGSLDEEVGCVVYTAHFDAFVDLVYWTAVGRHSTEPVHGRDEAATRVHAHRGSTR